MTGRRLSDDEYKKVILNVMVNIDEYCRQNNISYCLCGGTLIGSIRHKGFIPWDDDIDIVMMREDYEKFIAGFNCGRNDNIRVISIDNCDEYFLPFAKVCDFDVHLKQEINPKVEIGAFVDVFPYDAVPSEKDGVSIYMKNVLYQRMINAKIEKLNKKRSIINSLKIIAYKTLALPFTYKKLIKKLNKNSAMYNSNQSNKFCAPFTSMMYGKKEIMQLEWFAKTLDGDFEGYKFKIPVGYDKYLKQLYGDYMKLPPKEKQVTHHSFEAYYEG